MNISLRSQLFILAIGQIVGLPSPIIWSGLTHSGQIETSFYLGLTPLRLTLMRLQAPGLSGITGGMSTSDSRADDRVIATPFQHWHYEHPGAS